MGPKVKQMKPTFTTMAAEIDALCQQRVADYPARREAYHQLNNKLADFCHWLQAQQTTNWQPAPKRVQIANELTPIFIGGYHKSGTTFVRDLLDGHSALSILPGDARLLRTLHQIHHLPLTERRQRVRELWVHRLVNPTGLPPFWLFGRKATPYLELLNYLDYWFEQESDPERGMITPIARAFFCANPTQLLQARYWVDKTPLQELEIETLLRLYPQAKFVHVVRNPLASLAARKTMADKREHHFTLITQLPDFRQSLQQGLRYQAQLGLSQYVVVRYEDILREPTAVMQCVVQQLGLSYEEILTQPTINGSPSTPNSAYQENRVQGTIHKQSLDRWRTILSPIEVAHIVDALKSEATAYAYDWQGLAPTGLKRSGLRTVRSLVRLPQVMWHYLKR